MNIDPAFQSARVSVRSIAICSPWVASTPTEAVEATEAIEATEATHHVHVANHPYTPALNGGYVSVGSLYRDDSPPRNFKASADHHLFRMDTETNTYLLFSYGIHDNATWYIGVYPVLATDVDYLNNNSTTLGQTAQHSIGIGWNDFTGGSGHYPTEAYSPSHTLTGVYTPGTPAVAGTPGSVAVAAQPFTPLVWSSPMCMIRLIGASQPNNQEQLFASQPQAIQSSLLGSYPLEWSSDLKNFIGMTYRAANGAVDDGVLIAGTLVNQAFDLELSLPPGLVPWDDPATRDNKYVLATIYYELDVQLLKNELEDAATCN
jgi:hypothetical protein